MNVRELVTQLALYDPDLEVLVDGCCGGCARDPNLGVDGGTLVFLGETAESRPVLPPRPPALPNPVQPAP